MELWFNFRCLVGITSSVWRYWSYYLHYISWIVHHELISLIYKHVLIFFLFMVYFMWPLACCIHRTRRHDCNLARDVWECWSRILDTVLAVVQGSFLSVVVLWLFYFGVRFVVGCAKVFCTIVFLMCSYDVVSWVITCNVWFIIVRVVGGASLIRGISFEFWTSCE